MFCVKHLDPEQTYLLFYVNQPSIIIGKNQNTIEEINTKYVEDNGIIVVRRLSGGGAVYHDLGNLNFSFITKDDGDSFHNFKKFTEPVIQALRQLGVEAELSGRNDIVEFIFRHFGKIICIKNMVKQVLFEFVRRHFVIKKLADVGDTASD